MGRGGAFLLAWPQASQRCFRNRALYPQTISVASGLREDFKLLIFFYQSQRASFLRYIIKKKKKDRAMA